ncbi:alpha/beta hydrolase [Myxococcota bacterium]
MSQERCSPITVLAALSGVPCVSLAALLIPVVFPSATACARPQPVPTESSVSQPGSASPQLGLASSSAAAKPFSVRAAARVSAAEASSPSGVFPTDSSLSARELTWDYPETSVGPMRVVVSIPARNSQQTKLPVLIAMHGRGEAFKGPARGARAWVDDYWLPRALERLVRPPLLPADLLGYVEPGRLAQLNESLARRPYRGLIVVCPYTPDILAGNHPFSAARDLAGFLVDILLRRVYRETPAMGTPASTGVDGVSLGGRAALLVGFERSRSLGAVAGLQAAFDSADASELGRLAQLARKANPGLRLRLLTSQGDFFLAANRAISAEWRRRSLAHELLVLPGPHDYAFNRGPGVFEMLLFHDRALRGEPTL